jgi:hypothetical protein
MFIINKRNDMRTEWQRRIVVSAMIVSGLFLMGGTSAFAPQAGAASQDAQIKAAEAWAFAVFSPPDAKNVSGTI